MKIIEFVPGAVTSPNPITIPSTAPDIDAVIAAQIIRLPSAFTIPNHSAADIQAAVPIEDHPVHSHPFIVAGGGTGSETFSTGTNTFQASGTGGTLAGGGAVGVQNNSAPQAHSFGTGTAVTHGSNVGANPVVSATATRLSARTISLNVNTALGDLLVLAYREVGEMVAVS